MKDPKWLFKTSLFLLYSVLFVVQASAAPKPSAASAGELTLNMKIPVFSPLFRDTPVAAVHGHPILLEEVIHEFTTQDGKVPEEMSATALTQEFDIALARLIAEKKKADKGEEAKEDVANAAVRRFASPGIGRDRTISLHVPVFSPLFAKTPVAEVGGQTILLSEFVENLVDMHQGMTGKEKAPIKEYSRVLDRLMTVKLVLKEARNMGLDEIPEVKKRIVAFKEKTLLKALLGRHLQGLKPDQKKIEELYKKVSQEVKTRTYSFRNGKKIQAVMKKFQDGADFDKLMAAAVKSGEAEGGEDEGYVVLKKLRPMIAQEAYSMKVGGVSKIFKENATTFLIFKLEDRRFVKDPAALEKAKAMVLQEQQAKEIQNYMAALEKKYVTYSDKGKKNLDFVKVAKAAPKEKMSALLDKMLDNKQVLATIDAGSETVTVAEVAKRVKESFFHGVDQQGVTPQKINEKKTQILATMFFKTAGRLEAYKLGVDQSRSYKKRVAEFTNNLLFGAFVQKAVLPDIDLNEAQLHKYYAEHKTDYATPKMLRMKSLVFHTEKEAMNTVRQLRYGSDFNWVAANVKGLVPAATEGVLPFDGKILSVTAVPEGLQKVAATAGYGDVLFYADPGKFFYALVVDGEFPPKPKPYKEVRKDIGRKLYKMKLMATLNAYTAKLKSVYKTKNFIVVN